MNLHVFSRIHAIFEDLDRSCGVVKLVLRFSWAERMARADGGVRLASPVSFLEQVRGGNSRNFSKILTPGHFHVNNMLTFVDGSVMRGCESCFEVFMGRAAGSSGWRGETSVSSVVLRAD